MAEAYAHHPPPQQQQEAAAEEEEEQGNPAAPPEPSEGPTDMLLLKKAEQRRQRDLYTALNLEEGASPDDVRGAYLRLAALMHPDKHGGGSPLRADAEEVGLGFVVERRGGGGQQNEQLSFVHTGREDQLINETINTFCFGHDVTAIPAHRPRVQGADGPLDAPGLRFVRRTGTCLLTCMRSTIEG